MGLEWKYEIILRIAREQIHRHTLLEWNSRKAKILFSD